MAELNIDKNSPPDQSIKHPHPPTKDLIRMFNEDFKTAKKTTDTTNPEKNDSKPPETPTNKLNKKTTLLNQHDHAFSDLFPEFGLTQIKQIDAILIEVTEKIEPLAKNTVLETYYIVLDKMNTSFKLNFLTSNQKKSMTLTCDQNLHALLTTYLPELKSHLRKKSINFDEIILELESGDEDAQTPGKKNNA